MSHTAEQLINLTPHECEVVESLINNPETDPQILLRARILQLSNIKEPKPLQVKEIAEIVGVSRQTTDKLRRVYRDEGFEVAISVRMRGGYEKCMRNNELLVEQVKSIIAEPPSNGSKRWSLRALCKECVNRGYVSSICPASMQILLQRSNIEL